MPTRETLIARLPPTLTSFWIISSQISPNFLKLGVGGIGRHHPLNPSFSENIPSSVITFAVWYLNVLFYYYPSHIALVVWKFFSCVKNIFRDNETQLHWNQASPMNGAVAPQPPSPIKDEPMSPGWAEISPSSSSSSSSPSSSSSSLSHTNTTQCQTVPSNRNHIYWRLSKIWNNIENLRTNSRGRDRADRESSHSGGSDYAALWIVLGYFVSKTLYLMVSATILSTERSMNCSYSHKYVHITWSSKVWRAQTLTQIFFCIMSAAVLYWYLRSNVS